MIFEAFDVVVVPFPFTDKDASRRRPALIVSNGEFGRESGHSLLAMITRGRQSTWPLDVPISDLAAAGLTIDCVVRMKLFTLDHRLILRRTGKLGAHDAGSVGRALRRLIAADAVPPA